MSLLLLQIAFYTCNENAKGTFKLPMVPFITSVFWPSLLWLDTLSFIQLVIYLFIYLFLKQVKINSYCFFTTQFFKRIFSTENSKSSEEFPDYSHAYIPSFPSCEADITLTTLRSWGKPLPHLTTAVPTYRCIISLYY